MKLKLDKAVETGNRRIRGNDALYDINCQPVIISSYQVFL